MIVHLVSEAPRKRIRQRAEDAGTVSTPPCTSVRGTGYVFMTAVHGGSPREVPRYERHVEAIINQWTIMSVWGLREEYLPQRELNWTKLQVGQLERKWVWVEP